MNAESAFTFVRAGTLLPGTEEGEDFLCSASSGLLFAGEDDRCSGRGGAEDGKEIPVSSGLAVGKSGRSAEMDPRGRRWKGVRRREIGSIAGGFSISRAGEGSPVERRRWVEVRWWRLKAWSRRGRGELGVNGGFRRVLGGGAAKGRGGGGGSGGGCEVLRLRWCRVVAWSVMGKEVVADRVIRLQSRKGEEEGNGGRGREEEMAAEGCARWRW